ncbi:winged helix DNA-binding domain-containing protein [Streptomyces sp. ICN988]|uniref:winged helix DNA-binding domain-containing protein n=1 Tax=Streptomyces sp. ICN988 TaxID=2983765 RepID=UPI0021E42026|nr:winged helix DNA-binding domain-containing protein [Streptomyces sp. ICN988]MCV2458638.1 winged helix DNA-binding domain-containing protein [Streptomyces sp. ICN988]
MPRTSRPRSLTWSQVAAWRLRRHHLVAPFTAPDAGDAVEGVASALCGVHAQVMSSAEQAVAARTRLPDAAAAVRAALWDDRRLVKTWAMRGTLHLLPAAELPSYVAALRHDGRLLTERLLEQQGIAPRDVELVLEALPEALGAETLTREELAERLGAVTGDEALGEKVRSGWGVLLKPAARRGLLCFGPQRGRNVTFCAPRHWLDGHGGPPGGTTSPRAPGPEEAGPLEPARALGRMLERYLRAYGPAAPDDFARWWGTGTPEVRAALRELGEAVEATSVEGHRAWALREDVEEMARPAADDAPVVRLLPGFDPYVVGVSRQLASLLPDPALRPKVSRTAGWISPVLVVDGLIGGVWTARPARRTEVEVETFVPLRPGLRRRVAEEAEALLASGDHEVVVRFA